jgi:hypothetical protein
MLLRRRTPRAAGASIAFGMKAMDESWSESRERQVIYGFHFIKLEIPLDNPVSGEIERQLFVAVKIPREGDISSAYILKQEIDIPRDIRILQSDFRVQTLADWHIYALTGRFYPPIPQSGWAPKYVSNLGMQDTFFNAARFEEYLQSVDQPLRELCNLIAWISGFTPGKPTGQIPQSIYEARYYMENRYNSMVGELRLREAAGSHYEPDSTVLDYMTDDAEGYDDIDMMGGLKLGYAKEVEKVTPLRSVTHRGFGRGGKAPPGKIHKKGRSGCDNFQS